MPPQGEVTEAAPADARTQCPPRRLARGQIKTIPAPRLPHCQFGQSQAAIVRFKVTSPIIISMWNTLAGDTGHQRWTHTFSSRMMLIAAWGHPFLIL